MVTNPTDFPVRLAIAATIVGHLASSKEFASGGELGIDINRCAQVALALADTLIQEAGK